MKRLEGKAWIPVCPEQMAGLKTPRPPIFFSGGTGRDALRGEARIVSVDGEDVTLALWSACKVLARVVRRWKVRVAVLKEKSPSCGVERTYVGNTILEGEGIFTAALRVEGVEIFSEETLSKRGGTLDI